MDRNEIALCAVCGGPVAEDGELLFCEFCPAIDAVAGSFPARYAPLRLSAETEEAAGPKATGYRLENDPVDEDSPAALDYDRCVR